MSTGYDFGRNDLALLLIRRFYPERTDRESKIIHAWLEARGKDFDAWSFSVRVGQGVAPDPSHLPGVQANTVFSSKKRIDILCWQGQQPYIGEVKLRVNPQALGQLQTYRHLWLEENPDARDPRLFAIGAFSDDDTIRVLNANGVDVFLYPEAITVGGSPAGGVSPVNNQTA
jgi:hypothetical protein